MPTELPVTLTVRGTLVPSTLDAARVLHNDTAGSAPGIAAARALGDLSHKVFAPTGPNAKAGELLFLDVWCDAGSIMQFFGNPETQRQAGQLFSAKDASVWMPARGAFTYQLPAPRAGEAKYVGLIRGQVASPEEAIAAFARAQVGGVRAARLRGILSHELFVKLGPPGEPVELLGLDRWSNAEGMGAHYTDKQHLAPIMAAFSGAVATSVWEQAPGSWSEW